MRFSAVLGSLYVACVSATPRYENDVFQQQLLTCRSDDIADVAKAAGLTSLLSAIESAGLTDTVEDLRDVTVFAPTNDAFKAVGDPTTLPRSQLSDILMYHIAPGVARSSSLKDGMMVPTLEGRFVQVSVGGSGIKLNNAKVIQADIKVKQGIVHVIDKVLMPSSQGQAAPKSCSN